MEANILTAIKNIANNPVYNLRQVYQSRNRINSMGEALEIYIKDTFADTINEKSEEVRNKKYNQTFSYLGNQNNPPDIIIKNSDAIEVKKIESEGSKLALNSSYPKAKLFSDSPMITHACRDSEVWSEKDIIYAVGVVDSNNLRSLCFVYGVDYAASATVYERIKNHISSGILTIPDIQFAETKELGRVNRIDPLGITYLRIRGMWHIHNPMKVFDYIYQIDINKDFNFMAIINKEKYNSFNHKTRYNFENELIKNKNMRMSDVKIKIPDNPAKLRSVKLIEFSV